MRAFGLFSRKEVKEFLADFYDVESSASTSVSVYRASWYDGDYYQIVLEPSGVVAELLRSSLHDGSLRRWGQRFGTP